MSVEASEDASSRYWIEPGIKVKLVYGGPEMEVMRVLQTITTMPDGKKVTKMQGVKCRWTDDFGDERTGIYHSKTLVKAGQ
jgi:uncharacterized protein YodC (DUF2158 family)